MPIRRNYDNRVTVADARTVPGLLEGLHAPAWMADALCAQTDPEAWFPEKGGSTREAKQVCGRCHVAAECLDHAIATQERFGIWGGLSERERRHLKHVLNNTNHTQEEARP